MNRRLVLTVVAVVAVALLWGLLGYHPATEQSDTPFHDREPNESYAATFSLVANGEQFAKYDVTHDRPDREIVADVSFENVTYTLYWDGDRTVTRSVSDTEEQYQRMLITGSDERVVHRDNESMTAITVEANVSDSTRLLEGRGLILDILQYPDYAKTGSTTYEGREVAVYEPQNGWYETDSIGAASGTAIKIENAEGVVYADEDTGQLYYANVSYDSVGANTWGEYALDKYVKGEVATTELTVEYRFSGTEVEPPEWVPSDQSGSAD